MSETRGRCRREMDSLHGCNRSTAFHVLADALDRLAADVAEVKEAAVPARAMSDVFEKHLAAAIREREEAIRERDEAIRERGEAWEEIRRVKTELAERPWPVGWMVEVERLKGRRDEATKERDAAIRERDEARAEVDRLHAELAARPTAAGWLTEDECWKLRVAVKHLKRLGSGTVNTIEALLARAGSPPVVEVPVMPGLSGAATGEAWRYRAALDKAGVAWREVPRE